jgi:hypothetical protein
LTCGSWGGPTLTNDAEELLDVLDSVVLSAIDGFVCRDGVDHLLRLGGSMGEPAEPAREVPDGCLYVRARLTPWPAKQDEARDDTQCPDDRPERIAGHR